MRSAAATIAWEFWSSNRRGWLLVLATIPSCTALYRVFAAQLHDSDVLQSFSYLPLAISLIAAIGFCSFTDRTRRDEIAGFPRHLFVRPVNTRLLVACVMTYGVSSVVAIYIVWVKLVFEPIDIPIVLWWPVALLAAGVVFYQAILWCLCGYRLMRIVCLSLMGSFMCVAGCIPMQDTSARVAAIRTALLFILVMLAAAAYVVTLVTVSAQRRGWKLKIGWGNSLIEVIQNAIPRRRWRLTTPDAALLWIEWQRSGVVLPLTVVLALVLILGPVMWITGRGPDATMRAAMWLTFLPMILAFPIGIGFGKQDIWSLELSLPSFVAARPVSCGQLIAAKLKSAAISTLMAWVALLLIAPLGIYLSSNAEHVRDVWGILCTLYSPISRGIILSLCLLTAMAITWSLLVGSLWIGYAGRPGRYYAFACVGVAGLIAALICMAWWADHPQGRGEAFANALPWIPWFLAGTVTFKAWIAVVVTARVRARRLITDRHVVYYVLLWITITACLLVGASLISPRVDWLRYLLILAALCAFPAVCMAAAPLAVYRNRHR